MKDKKLFLPAVILAAAAAAMIVFALVFGIAQKPTITEGAFPFSVTYELNGKTETIADVYEVRYTGNGGHADTKTRIYKGEIAGKEDAEATWYVLSEGTDGRIILNTKLYADYMMGDTKYDYFDDGPFEPQILYYDAQEIEYVDKQTLAEHGVKLVSWEYPAPIENSFVFSHISRMSGSVVLPMVFIELLALLAVIVFVKKDRDSGSKVLSKISLILNFAVFFAVVPFITILGIFLDINGGSANPVHQMGYLLAPITILGIAASVGLRRKGYDKSACIVQLFGPALLAVFALLFTLL